MTMSQSLTQIVILAGAIAVLASYQFIGATWTEPGSSPAGGNVPAPLTVGTSTASDQLLRGSLGVDALAVFGDAAVTGQVNAAQYCDETGSGCVTPGGWGDWEDLTSVRSRNTWYTNTDSVGRYVAVLTSQTSDVNVRADSSSPNIKVSDSNGDSSDAPWEDESFIVPPGWQYRVDASGIRFWSELRLPF